MELTHTLSSDFFKANREKLKQWLPPRAAVLIWSGTEVVASADMSFPFEVSRNFWYLTGLNIPEALLIICPDLPYSDLQETLILVRTTEAQKIWEGVRVPEEEISQISGIDNVIIVEREKDVYKLIARVMWHAIYVYIEVDEHERYNPYPFPDSQRQWVKKLMELYPAHQYRRLYQIMTQLRMVKSTKELERMKVAVRKAADILTHDVLPVIKGGIKENELEGAIIGGALKRGCVISFPCIIAGGSSACILHYSDNNRVIEKNSFVLIDWGVKHEFYCSDMTRVIPVGKPPGRFFDIYEAVYTAHEKIKEFIMPGKTWTEVQDYAMKVVGEELVKLGLLSSSDLTGKGWKGAVRKYFMHGFGHHIGLDVHDPYFADEPMQPGMVLTCEPGIYVREEGIGIRIENEIVVTERGAELLEPVLPYAPDWVRNLTE